MMRRLSSYDVRADGEISQHLCKSPNDRKLGAGSSWRAATTRGRIAVMAASPIDRIVALLASDAPEKRIAAAIVLGELKARGPKVVSALAASLEDGGSALQRHALDALARVGAAKVVPAIFPLLGSRDAAVREAAVNAIVRLEGGRSGAASVGPSSP